MLNSIETDVSRYMISEDSKDLFHNISLFSKNMLLKSCDAFDDAETDISKWWGDMYLKYCNSRLSLEDVETMLVFIHNYNARIRELIDGLKVSNETDNRSEESIRFLLKCFGLYKDQNYSQSVLYILMKACLNWLSENDKAALMEIQNMQDYEYQISAYILLKILTVKNNEDTYKLNIPYAEVEVAGGNTNIPTVILDKFLEFREQDVLGELPEERTFFDKVLSDSGDADKPAFIQAKISDIKGALVSLINKESIFTFVPKAYNSDMTEKLSASNSEMSIVMNGSHIPLFDLCIRQDNITTILSAIESTYNIPFEDMRDEFGWEFPGSATKDISTRSVDNISIIRLCILYKELNPKYRDAIDAESVELALNSYSAFSSDNDNDWSNMDKGSWNMRDFVNQLNSGSGYTCAMNTSAGDFDRNIEKNLLLDDFLTVGFGQTIPYYYDKDEKKAHLYINGWKDPISRDETPSINTEFYYRKLKKYYVTIEDYSLSKIGTIENETIIYLNEDPNKKISIVSIDQNNDNIIDIIFKVNMSTNSALKGSYYFEKLKDNTSSGPTIDGIIFKHIGNTYYTSLESLCKD